MRFFTLLTALSPLLISVAYGLTVPSTSSSLVQRDEQCDLTAEYCAAYFPSVPPVDSMTVVDKRSALTNAQRLQRGLPLKAPTRRSTARRNTPSSIPSTKVTKRGVLKVVNTASGQELGYLSKSSFSGAQFRYQSLAQAMTVSFEMEATATSAFGVQIVMEDSDITSGFPLLGLVQGRDNANSDISMGSFHYLYLSGIASPGSPADTPPSNIANAYTAATGTPRTAESDVWYINLQTGSVAATWTNTDSSHPALSLFTQSTALYAGGDTSAFSARYPSPVTPIILEFVERSQPV